jgi:hypothetical protein
MGTDKWLMGEAYLYPKKSTGLLGHASNACETRSSESTVNKQKEEFAKGSHIKKLQQLAEIIKPKQKHQCTSKLFRCLCL